MPSDPADKFHASSQQALFAAIQAGDELTVRTLLAADQSLADRAGPDGFRPLHIAAEWDRDALAELLIAAGATPVSPEETSIPDPLIWAITCGGDRVADVLLRHGAAMNLWCAAGLGRLGDVQRLVDDPSVSAIPAVSSIAANTDALSQSLYIAARNGRLDVAAWLLTRGADPNVRAFFGAGPLHWALANGHWAVAELLLAHGADSSQRDDEFLATTEGFAICLAANHGRADIVAGLLARDTSLASYRAHWGTPLHEAAFFGHIEVANLLLAGGADPLALNAENRTAAQIAAARGHDTVARQLDSAANGKNGTKVE